MRITGDAENDIPHTTRTCRLCSGEPMAPWPPAPGKGPTHHTCYPGEERGTIERLRRAAKGDGKV